MKSSSTLKPAVVLVADRTLSARYRILFEGMFATMQTTQTPPWLMRHFLAPPVATDELGRAAIAPLGLRRLEATLGRTLGGDQVVVTTPERLPDLLGPWVKVVGVSSSDPLGRGMSNTTTQSFSKGQLYTRYWLDRMMEFIRDRKSRLGFKVIGGGGGAWQWRQDAAEARRQGLDAVFCGYFESRGPAVIDALMNNQPTPFRIDADGAAVAAIEPIVAGSLMGGIELSRGCGKGCGFCAMAHQRMEHLPPDLILRDVQRNLACGIDCVASGSEDFFRYGGTGGQPNFHALRDLLEQMRQLSGLSMMQIDHANISTVLQMPDEQLIELRRLMQWSRPMKHLWVNMGVESASGRLVQANGPGKIAPYRPEDWPEMALEAGHRMKRCGYFPVFSLVLGLPGETPDDVAATQRLAERLGEMGSVIFPVFHEPLLEASRREGLQFTCAKMRMDHLRLYTTCYEINFKHVPPLIWDNQRAGGVGWARRCTLQALGRGEMFLWRRNFRRLRKRLANAAPARRTARQPQPADV